MNLTEVNNDGDSSDSENENDVNESSDDELSFESDDEGNYQQNLNKKHSLVNESDSDEPDDEEGDEEEEDDDDDDEGSEDEELSEDEAEVSGESDIEDDPESAYISDDSEELSFEEDESVDGENEPNVSANNKSKKPPKAIEASKQNGKTTTNAKPKATEKPSKAPERPNKSKNQPTNAVDAFKTELKQSGSSTNGTGSKNAEPEDDEYKFDTDDEEDIRNTVGNIPMKWYDEYKHIGYDWDAKKIIKPPKRDQLDDFLKRMEDPNFWRTVKDPQTGQDVILSDADIDLIKRINARRVPDANFDDYAVRLFIILPRFRRCNSHAFFLILICTAMD